MSSSEERVESVRVSGLKLRDFRNYRHLDLELETGFHLVVGPNGIGKTNFLEALSLVSTTRLLRGIRDAEAVMEGAERALVEVEADGASLGVTLRPGVRKRATLNGMNLPRPADMIGRLPSVTFSANDLPIVRGGAEERRLFLDMELSQLFPAYLRHLSVYKRALDQRNALLRAAQEHDQPSELFEIWEEELSQHGSALRRMRASFVEALAAPAAEAHADLGQGEELRLAIAYKDESLGAEQLRAAYERGRGSEIARGSSVTGPHRDDLEIFVGGRPARLFGSQGQQRTAVIALKLAVFDVSRQELKRSPLLLMDDVFSDLDEGRRSRLIERVIGQRCQALITCTEPEQAGAALLGKSRVLRVASVLGEAVIEAGW